MYIYIYIYVYIYIYWCARTRVTVPLICWTWCFHLTTMLFPGLGSEVVPPATTGTMLFSSVKGFPSAACAAMPTFFRMWWLAWAAWFNGGSFAETGCEWEHDVNSETTNCMCGNFKTTLRDIPFASFRLEVGMGVCASRSHLSQHQPWINPDWPTPTLQPIPLRRSMVLLHAALERGMHTAPASTGDSPPPPGTAGVTGTQSFGSDQWVWRWLTNLGAPVSCVPHACQPKLSGIVDRVDCSV